MTHAFEIDETVLASFGSRQQGQTVQSACDYPHLCCFESHSEAAAQVLYAKGPQSSTRGAMILQAYLHPDAAAATAASNAQGTFPRNICVEGG